ncbi:MAG: D-alanyl-D-alanine carboxypeptidase/D-alanyl-D-alanine-endopeptidase [Sedimentisphaerales bacterium]|nr:D-alanyl-D-alanine carboxypeptidase/D-alanyl-D-alanine-endopeptidase [Sedimentisphaerales bacterium]
MSTKKYIFCLIILVFSISCQASLQKKIEKIITHKDQAKVKYGILVIDPCSGTRIFEHNENLPLVPASNMKLITGFAALKFLSRDFEYITTAAILDKKLVIIGSGDPLLGYEGDNKFISDIIEALKKRNITEIKDIIIDTTVFDDMRVHPNWPKDQLNRSYACEVSGVNYNGNCVRILASNNKGEIRLSTEPDTEYVKLLNHVKPVNKGNSAIASARTHRENVVTIYGKCRKAASFNIAIERPAAFFGFLLAEALNDAGIKTSGQLTEAGIDSKDMQVICEHKTDIIEVLKRCDKDSLQLAAESLFKTLGAKEGRDGSWQGGKKVITDYLVALGASEVNFNIDDGSGLSGENKMTASIIVRLLADAYSSDLWPVFQRTLATGGIDGTLKNYFHQGKYKGKVFAKTGYINGVRALSGFCIAGDKKYLFSILTNDANYKTKEAIFNIVKTIIDEG